MNDAILTVAIVDDDETVRRALRRVISSLAYRPLEFASGEAFLTELAEGMFGCALIDLHMPDLNGIDVLLKMRSDGHATPAIIMTGGDEPRMRERCMRAGASAYLIKPLERSLVHAAIKSVSR